VKAISIKLLDYCHYIFFIIFTIIGLFIYQDYGFNIDETFTRKSGLYWLVFLSDFFSFDEISKLASEKLNTSDDFTMPWSNTYGIIFDVPAALIEILFSIDEPLKVYQMRHVLTFFYFLVGSIFLYKILQNRFKNKLLSLFGCFLLILTPRVFGEIFHNSKDIVFLSLFIITIFFYFKTIEKGDYKYLILFSLFSAFTTSTRIFGILIPVIFLFIYFLSVLSNKKEIKNYKTIIVYLLLYFFFLYFHWPYLWEAPFNNFFEYFKNLNIFGPKMIYFSGEYYNTELVPYSYLPVWIFISTPILNLLFFFLGFYFNFKIFLFKLLEVDEVKNKYDFWNNINEKKDFFILILFIVFIIAGIFLSPKQYNGWRIFYFLNFFIVYYSIFFINYFTKNKDFKKYIIPLSAVTFFLISINIYKIFIYHPYQSYYFNDFITKEVKRQFEGDYSGLSGISFLREITKEDKSSNIKIAVNSWYPLWRMKELLPHKDKIRIKFIFNNKNEANYIYSNEIFDVDVRKSEKYKLDPSFKIYKRYIVNDVIIYKIYTKK
tara:strand:- start:1846 stop:3480 length:1635 start_codon:yes stop_codon:yes gene_type:complete